MKVLFICANDPYSYDNGAALRTRPFIKMVAKEGEAHLFAPQAKANETQFFSKIIDMEYKTHGRFVRTLRSMVTAEPDLLFRSRGGSVAKALHAGLLAEKYDVVHIAGLQLGYLVETFIDTTNHLRKHSEAPTLLVDEFNAEFAVYNRGDLRTSNTFLESAYYKWQSRLLEVYEKRVLPIADLVTCPSHEDMSHIKSIAPQANISIIPSGIDLQRYDGVGSPSKSPTMAMIADYSYRPNREGMDWFLEHIYPAVCKANPNVKLYLVGKSSGRFDNAASGVIATGYVDDVVPYLRLARVVIAPLLTGGGIKMKVVEGMAASRPVITTPIGVEGLKAVPGRDVIVQSEPAVFASELVRLIRADSEAEYIASNAYLFASKFLSSDTAGRTYYEALNTVVRSREYSD